MNTKQKKTLLGAIVALFLVGTIVSVAMAASGCFAAKTAARSTPTGPPNLTDSQKIDNFLKKIKSVIRDKTYECLYLVELRKGVRKLPSNNAQILKEVTVHGRASGIAPENVQDVMDMDVIDKLKIDGRIATPFDEGAFHSAVKRANIGRLHYPEQIGTPTANPKEFLFFANLVPFFIMELQVVLKDANDAIVHDHTQAVQIAAIAMTLFVSAEDLVQGDEANSQFEVKLSEIPPHEVQKTDERNFGVVTMMEIIESIADTMGSTAGLRPELIKRDGVDIQKQEGDLTVLFIRLVSTKA